MPFDGGTGRAFTRLVRATVGAVHKHLLRPPLIKETFHLIWFGGRALPELAVHNMERLRTLYPHAQVRLWTDADLKSMPEEVQARAARKNFAMASDLARVWILLRHGGVYLDVDVEPTRDGFFAFLEREQPQADLIMAFEDDEVGLINGCMLAASSGSAGCERLFGYMNTAKLRNSLLPGVLTAFVADHGSTNISVLPQKLVSPYNPYSRSELRRYPTKANLAEAYFVHHFAHTWRDPIHKRVLRKIARAIRRG